MRLAETVTFGGSGLERAAARRGDAGWQADAQAQGDWIVLWRGSPAFGPEGALVRLKAGHPLLADPQRVAFLGVEETGTAVFAADISGWTPPAGTEAAPAAGVISAGVQTHPDLPEGAAFEDLRARMTGLSPRDAELAATARALMAWHDSHGFCARCGVASDMAEAGWQRCCPACNAMHFPRTDPVVIMLVERGNQLLLGRSPGWPEGMYSLLAGFMEPGETLEAAVRREVAEETGVQIGAVRYLASQPWPFPASLMLGARAEALSEAITVDPVELEEALWVSREEMVTVLAGQHPRIRPGRKGAIASFLIRNWLADRLD